MTDLERPDLSGQVALVTGTTRGIGKALALALADCGAAVVSTGKTVDDSDSDLEGTIHKTADAVRERGSESMAVQLDVRDADACEAAVEETVDRFGQLDLLVNNASAIQIASVEELPPKRFDLLMDVNARGTYAISRAAVPHLRDGGGRIVTNAPPLTVDRAPGQAAYAYSKLGMTFLTLSLAEELSGSGVAASTVWPVTAIDTRATRYFGLGTEEDWRTPEVYCDAVLELLRREPESVTGEAFYDEELLREAGVEKFSRYAVVEGTDPGPTSARMFDPDFSRE
jgi:NAD(P)-dependent dehydrogenase (short-subunit alcohol dehydrogenase family)